MEQNYKNIEKIVTLDDGSVSVLMKEGKQAIIEFIKLNEKWQAKVYSMFVPEVGEPTKKKTAFDKAVEHEVYKDCAKEALGWIDENPLEFVPEEIREMQK